MHTAAAPISEGGELSQGAASETAKVLSFPIVETSSPAEKVPAVARAPKKIPEGTQSHLKELTRRHAALDEQVKQLERERAPDSLAVQALKKKKLALKEEMRRLKAQYGR
ncbi:MAG: DUF465 domain-containing protein [Patescibacteria group bacterium]